LDLPIIHIFTIGKWKAGSLERDLYNAYVGRSKWQINLYELSELSKLPFNKRQLLETESLFSAAKQHGCEEVFALDETGKHCSSVDFAHKLQKLDDSGIRKIAFLIGGDVGFNKKLLFTQQAVVFSFGSMTWPHLLVRTMLSEQLYRAQTIINNHPYHRH
jgi:23S rRNA (pseudouridine1915-N3)-methyltransferase